MTKVLSLQNTEKKYQNNIHANVLLNILASVELS